MLQRIKSLYSRLGIRDKKMKINILTILLFYSIASHSQYIKEGSIDRSQLDITVIDILQNKGIDTFTVHISSIYGDKTFEITGKNHQYFYLDSNAHYKVTIIVSGFKQKYYEWEYNEKKRNFKMLKIHCYPDHFTEKQRSRVWKKYLKTRKKENKGKPKTIGKGGLYWEHEEYVY